MVQSSSPQRLYVDGRRGNDNAQGTQAAPLQSITQALQRAKPGTTIQLAPGTYTTATGEIFPLRVPPAVTLIGSEQTRGREVKIEGSGVHLSATFGPQNVTLVPSDGAEIRGVMVSNRADKGTGIWVESTAPTIAYCTLSRCRREGIFVLGTGRPLIEHSIVERNGASGIFLVRQAKGEIRQTTCRQTGYGIAISDQAAPLLAENQITDNRSGIVVSRSARPVLRQNQVTGNQNDGLTVLDSALPDLGDEQEPGDNIFANNGRFDLQNRTPTPLVSAGNQINPTRLDGNVQLRAIALPPLPAAAPPRPPLPSPPVPPPGQSRFSDVAPDHWALPFINALVERRIVNGFPNGTFRPEDSLTRAQYAVLVTQAIPLPLRQVERSFRDVAPDFWAAAVIQKATRMGFIAGFPDQTFRPNEPLTRVQAIVSLVNGIGLTGGGAASLQVYGDRAQIPDYATNAVAIATQNRLVVNHPSISYLEPLVPISRAEMVTMLYQVLVLRGEVRAIASPFIVSPLATTAAFADVQNHWAASFVQGLASQNLAGGFVDGTFKPDVAMNRAQFAALLAAAFHPQPQQAAITFIDVPDAHWAAAAIQQVVRGGLMTGFGDGTFQPQQDVHRLQVLLSLVAALNLPPGDPELLVLYSDRDHIPADALHAIASATEHRLVVNYPSPRQLSPHRGATRAEVAAMLYQALVSSQRARSVASPYTVNELSPAFPLTNLGPGSAEPPPTGFPRSSVAAAAIGTVQTVDSQNFKTQWAAHSGLSPLIPPSPQVLLFIYASDKAATAVDETLPLQQQAIGQAIAHRVVQHLNYQGVAVLQPEVLPGKLPRLAPLLASAQLAIQIELFLNPASPHPAIETRFNQIVNLGQPLATQLHRSLIDYTGAADQGLHPLEPSGDLAAVSIPAVHLQWVGALAFLSPRYQAHLAWAIAYGILTYIQFHHTGQSVSRTALKNEG
ncbi:MAG: S-layer homology domain-containing protein [Synechococcales bacterium]|nr:S-layer homology domain-containing protein [Synechococcales bacterium]